MREDQIIKVSLLVLAGSILYLLHSTKKPLCVHSRVVHRIYRYEEGREESIFSCAIRRSVPYSKFFQRHHEELSININKIVPLLEFISPFRSKIEIALTSQKSIEIPQFYKIYLNEKDLADSDIIARLFIRIWLQERFFPQDELEQTMEMALEDFLAYLKEGNIFSPEYPSFQSETYEVRQAARGLIASYFKSDLREKFKILKALPDFLARFGSSRNQNEKQIPLTMGL